MSIVINVYIKPVNYLLLTLGISALCTCSPAIEPLSRDQPVTAHDETILKWARERHGEQMYAPVEIFYGDFTGDGVSDALAWILYPSGGNSDYLHVALFRNDGGSLVYHRSVDGVFGGNPRDVVFEQGRITLTTTMPNPGDPRCCPTGSQDWVIDTQ